MQQHLVVMESPFGIVPAAPVAPPQALRGVGAAANEATAAASAWTMDPLLQHSPLLSSSTVEPLLAGHVDVDESSPFLASPPLKRRRIGEASR